MVQENKELLRQVRSLEEIAARFEAEELLAIFAVEGTTASSRELETRHPKLETTSVEGQGMRIVAHVFDNRDAESLRRLGARDKETARLVFARSGDATGNMNILMREACATLNGRGGGKPDMAQGGGQQVEKLADAIEAARLAVQAGGVPDAPGKDKVADGSAGD
jgi:alanyl-tRNA synthetase